MSGLCLCQVERRTLFLSLLFENRQIAFQNPNLQNVSQVTRIVIAPFYHLPKDLKPAGCLMRGHVAVGQREATLEASPEPSTPPGVCVFERPEPPSPLGQRLSSGC